MKRKLILLTYLILLLILISISRCLLTKQATQNKSNKNQLKNISYYKEENLVRYIKYQNNNKKLSPEEIVTNVNIGLDNAYYTNIKPAKNVNTTKILVNKYNYLSRNYIPKNLETINSKYASPNMKLVTEARVAFEEMAKNAEENNLNIIAMSSYRSYEYQEILYTRYVQTDGKEKADTYSARPGHSEHQTGLAIDVYNKILPYTEFESTKEFIWMQENAYKYGFILRYPLNKSRETGYQYEPWHYRYVGYEIAKYITENKITYEEYFVKYLDK